MFHVRQVEQVEETLMTDGHNLYFAKTFNYNTDLSYKLILRTKTTLWQAVNKDLFPLVKGAYLKVE